MFQKFIEKDKDRYYEVACITRHTDNPEADQWHYFKGKTPRSAIHKFLDKHRDILNSGNKYMAAIHKDNHGRVVGPEDKEWFYLESQYIIDDEDGSKCEFGMDNLLMICAHRGVNLRKYLNDIAKVTKSLQLTPYMRFGNVSSDTGWIDDIKHGLSGLRSGESLCIHYLDTFLHLQDQHRIIVLIKNTIKDKGCRVFFSTAPGTSEALHALYVEEPEEGLVKDGFIFYNTHLTMDNEDGSVED